MDVSQNPNLEFLYIRSNNIVDLDISLNLNLIDFRCDNNQLINLNAKNGNNSKMNAFYSYDNPNLN